MFGPVFGTDQWKLRISEIRQSVNYAIPGILHSRTIEKIIFWGEKKYYFLCNLFYLKICLNILIFFYQIPKFDLKKVQIYV